MQSRNTILMLLIESDKRQEAVRVLQDYMREDQHGKDIVNAENHSGSTALTIAIRKGFYQMVHLLIECGARLNQTNR
jgi:ankyrin repeat protein